MKIVFAGLFIVMTTFSCKHKGEYQPSIGAEKESVFSQKFNSSRTAAPQITKITKSPDRLTKEVKTYTVTLITEGNILTLEETEFSIDGKDWKKTPEFTNVICGNHIFYARNKRNKSLLDQKEMHFECFVDVSLPTIHQLNELLKQIADCDDKASDELRKFGKNLPVHGVVNVSVIEQLVRNACINEVIYVVQKIETNENGNLAAIVIDKN